MSTSVLEPDSWVQPDALVGLTDTPHEVASPPVPAPLCWCWPSALLVSPHPAASLPGSSSAGEGKPRGRETVTD